QRPPGGCPLNRFLALAGALLMVSGCAAGADDDDVDDAENGGSTESGVSLRAGINGGACYMSPYNCKLRVEGGNRVAHTDGSLDWGVDTGVPVVDGNGTALSLQNGDTLKFNYGQERVFGGKHYVFALT